MTTNDKILRGEEILRDYEKYVEEYEPEDENGDYPAEYYYACSILHAISEDSHEVPIPRRKMCIALADADLEGKMISVVPDDDTIVREDGWRYHLEMV